jgi:hypothetical protein
METNLKVLVGASMGYAESGVLAAAPGIGGMLMQWTDGVKKVNQRVDELIRKLGSYSRTRRAYRAYLTMAVAHELTHCIDQAPWHMSYHWRRERKAILVEQAFILDMIRLGRVPADWAELYDEVNIGIMQSFDPVVVKQVDGVWGDMMSTWNGDIPATAQALFNKEYGDAATLPVWLAIYTRYRIENFALRPQAEKVSHWMHKVKNQLASEGSEWASK